MSHSDKQVSTNPNLGVRKPIRRVVTKVKAEVSHTASLQRETPDLCVIMIDNPDLVQCKPDPDADGVAQNVELMDVNIVEDEANENHHPSTVSHEESLGVPTTTVDWLPIDFTLTEVTEEYMCGYVRTEEQVQAVLQHHSRYTESIFCFKSSDDQYKKKRIARRLFYYSKLMNISSHITSNDRNKIYICNYGIKYRTKEREEPHCQYTRIIAKEGQPIRRCIVCPARIIINELTVYTEFGLEGITKKQKLEMMRSLKLALANKEDVSQERYIHMRLPLKNAHRGHLVSDYHWKLGRTHPNLLKKIEELTVCGLKNVKIIQAILKKYAEEELLEGSNVEEYRNLNYYFPTDKTIRNKMRFVTVKYNLKELHGSDTKKKVKSVKAPSKKKKREKEREKEFYQYEDYRIQ